ncbi:MAG: PilN domain-containing protein [Candidatus Latescibacteria bacterium]|nr:PilN domain-containing protein [Candidatus Latescibacterota bacterium]
MMIRVNLLGARKRKGGWQRHPVLAGAVILGLILLLTIGFFRFVRLLQEPSPPLTTPASEVVEKVDTLAVSTPVAAMDTLAPPEGAATTNDTTAVLLFTMIQETLPPFVWFSSLQSGAKGDYTIEGITFSSHRVNEFLEQLSRLSALCKMPEPMVVQEDNQGHKTFRFTICGTMRGGQVSPSPLVLSREEFSRFPDLLLSEGRSRQIRFLETPTWEDRPMSVKRGLFRATGTYRQVVDWLQGLERHRRGLTGFSMTPGREHGSIDTVTLSATIDVIVQ